MSGILNVLAADNAAAGGGAPTYATWNASDAGPNIVLSNGNLTVAASTAAYTSVRANQSKSSGKWYWEVTLDGSGSNSYLVGVANGDTAAGSLNTFAGNFAKSFGVFNGSSFVNGVTNDHGPTTAFAQTNIISVALDATAGKAWIAKNGTWLFSDPTGADAFSGMNVNGPWYPVVTANTAQGQTTTNFGATAFSFTVPPGYNSGFYT